MFYSHQLLARKAPLCQIWMAATMHAKMNRKKLDMIDIISICEEILNPSVPMALRLSGILMGGVVIVYERKVKLLYEDVTRLLVKINETWKVEPATDRTLLPKRKLQAKFVSLPSSLLFFFSVQLKRTETSVSLWICRKEAVTLPDVQDVDHPEIGQSRNFSSSNATMPSFQNTSYFAVQLDTLDETYINNDAMEDDVTGHMHQVDPENIKLFEHFDPCQVNTDMYDRFERFDISGEGDTQMNATFSGDLQTDMPSTVLPSQPRQDEDLGGLLADSQMLSHMFFICLHSIFGMSANEQGNPFTDKEIPDQQPESLVNQPSETHNVGREQTGHSKYFTPVNVSLSFPPEPQTPRARRQVQGPIIRKRRRQAANWMDIEKTVIPGEVYQSWLQNASDLTSRRDRKGKDVKKSIMSRMKVASLMELPPTVLIDDLSINANKDIYYPAPLLAQWTKSTQPPHDSPSARATSPQPPEASNSSPQDAAAQFEDPYNFNDYQGGGGSQSIGISFEKDRGVLNEQLEAHLFDNAFEANLVDNIRMRGNKEPPVITTPGNPGSGHGIPRHCSGINSGNIHSGSSLQSIPEDTLWLPDPEVQLKTGPAQSQRPITSSQRLKAMNEGIRMCGLLHLQPKYLKNPFKGPEAESLNSLPIGINLEQAAPSFYETRGLNFEFEAYLADNESIRGNKEPPVVTSPGNRGKPARFIPSSGSGHSIPRHRSEINSGHKHSGSSLQSIPENKSWRPDPDITTVHEKDSAPDQEVLLETGPTQTQPLINTSEPLDAMTEDIRKHLKTHFEWPKAPKHESLNNLATGMDRKRAALFFYQTCVLATRGDIAVDQKVPYGEILISNRSKKLPLFVERTWTGKWDRTHTHSPN
ncbi:unnamed protein product [Linum tenue]|uniref:Sister chromatid cohesion 1 protein 1 n=1 Tax=Linum tenue TaxID=586396 RepID=A0AAV0MBZ8_9ROSI|nr:unnamed protein product [Linum tenue]